MHTVICQNTQPYHSKQEVKEFWRQAASQEGGFFNVMWRQLPLLCWFCYWFFAVKTTEVTDSTCQWDRQTPKIALSPAGSGVLSSIWFLGPAWVNPQTASRSVQLLLQDWQTWLTDSHTHRDQPRYCVWINSLHLMQCMWCVLIVSK